MIKKKRARGFSLMELLAVMAIMGVLATVAVTGYFSAVRSMTRRRVVSNFVATLQQARQRACIDGARTAVVFFSEDTLDTAAEPNTYVMCKALGRITFIDGQQKIGDEFTPLDLFFGKASTATGTSGNYAFKTRRIFNLSGNGGFWEVKGSVSPGGDGVLESGITGGELSNTNLIWCFTKEGQSSPPPDFQMGDLYGVEASPVAKLPKNFRFSSATAVMFKPDGGAIASPIGIIDQSVKASPKVIATISVNDTNGSITGGDTVELN